MLFNEGFSILHSLLRHYVVCNTALGLLLNVVAVALLLRE